jgi:hypothetical protein
VNDLTAAIRRFITNWNDECAQAFALTKTAEEILTKANLNHLNSGH